jgi:hypothetical protein
LNADNVSIEYQTSDPKPTNKSLKINPIKILNKDKINKGIKIKKGASCAFL